MVTFPDLEGAVTGAATLDEALDEAADCLASWLAFALADHKSIPEPSVPKGSEFTISVPLWIAPKIALYKAMTEQSISNSELARKLGATENATKSTTLEAALKAAGRHWYLVYAA